MKRQRKWLVAGATGVLAAMWWWAQRPSTLTLAVGVVSEGPLRVTVDETGTTRVRAHTEVNAPVAGRWLPARLREGDVLPVGSELGVLRPVPLDSEARAQAQARLGVATALLDEARNRVVEQRVQFEEARRTRARVEALATAGGVSPQDAERARAADALRETELRAAEQLVRAGRFDQAIAASTLAGARGGGGAIRITAPIAGVLLTLSEPHERVVPPGTHLMEIGDPRDLEVVVPLLTGDVARVHEGAIARLTFGVSDDAIVEGSGPDTTVGRVVRVEPSAFTRVSALGVEEQRVNVVIAVPTSTAKIGDKFRADASIVVWESPSAVRVPVSALARDGNDWIVWRVKHGRADRRVVRMGERGSELAAVRAGLERGDSVVLYPPEALRTGTRVRRP